MAGFDLWNIEWCRLESVTKDIDFFFFFEKQLQHTANPATQTFSPLDLQALCAWRGVNSATRPLVRILICVCVYHKLFITSKVVVF